MPKDPEKELRASGDPEVPESRLVPYGDVRVGIVSEEEGERTARREWPPEEGLDLELAWVQLRGNWSWLVLVPAEPSDSTASIASSLSRVGARLSPHPIECIDASNVDLDLASRLVARLGSRGSRSGWTTGGGQPFPSSNGAEPRVKTLVALESPLKNPLALPVALAADGVVLCVRRGRDKLSSLRETIRALGADGIFCCLLIE